MTWFGTSDFTPDAALGQPLGRSCTPALVLLPNGSLMLDFVMFDKNAVLGAKHNATVGTIDGGVYTPAAQHVLGQGSGSPIAAVADGWAHIYVETSTCLHVSASEIDFDATMVVARTSFDLSSRVVQGFSLNDGGAAPWNRNTAISINGHAARLLLDVDGVTLTVTALDDVTLADGSPDVFTLDSSIVELHNIYAASGLYAAAQPVNSFQLMLRSDGASIVDAWTRSASATRILAPYPGAPGSFLALDTGTNEVIRIDMTPGSRTEAINAVAAVPYVTGGTVWVDAQAASASAIWTFLLGSGGS